MQTGDTARHSWRLTDSRMGTHLRDPDESTVVETAGWKPLPQRQEFWQRVWSRNQLRGCPQSTLLTRFVIADRVFQPCCTVNYPQGFPKFIASSFVKVGETGLAHVLLSPGSVETTIAGKRIKGQCNYQSIHLPCVSAHILTFAVDCVTNYPFSDTLKYLVSTETKFSLFVRIPEWAAAGQATVQAGSSTSSIASPDPSTGLFENVVLSGESTIEVKFPNMRIRTVTRDGAIAFYRGPILYASDVDFKQTAHRPVDYANEEPLPDEEIHPGAADYSITPLSEWRYAVDPSTVAVSEDRPLQDGTLPSPLFVRDGPPVSLTVDAYPIDWPLEHGTAAAPPLNPRVDRTSKTKLRLVPFGAAKLHIAQFPIAKLD